MHGPINVRFLKILLQMLKKGNLLMTDMIKINFFYTVRNFIYYMAIRSRGS